MTNHRKIHIGVIFGGRSGEHEVSLRSALSLIHIYLPIPFLTQSPYILPLLLVGVVIFVLVVLV